MNKDQFKEMLVELWQEYTNDVIEREKLGKEKTIQRMILPLVNLWTGSNETR